MIQCSKQDCAFIISHKCSVWMKIMFSGRSCSSASFTQCLTHFNTSLCIHSYHKELHGISNGWVWKHQYNNPSTEPFKGFIDPSRQPVEVKRNKKWTIELSLTVWTERSWRCRSVFVSFIWHFYDHVSWWCIHFCARLSVSASWLSVWHGRHDSAYLWKQNIVLMPVERAVALRSVAAVFALALPDTFINASICRKDRRKTSS